ncbi:MAG: inorganic phosphate transporter, PiT family [Actinomycetota bacterium]|nr:inorganic phosphate transporter, PiT family [Actinomycetota bacterium]MEA2487993.1 inorganic phosphate transporter, PiT family [Actinomycetota bacterium]
MPFSFAAGVIILVALSFDYVNGFHDAANSIATVVSTRVLSPRIAVAWAAFWNFVAFLIFKTAVAKTVGAGIIDLSQITSRQDGFNVILAALIGAIAFDLMTWYFGLPTSSSHALAGGLIGAALAYKGAGMLVSSGITKIALFIIISPIAGFVLSVVFMNIVLFVGKILTAGGHTTMSTVHKLFRRLQLFSAAAYSLGHGANDAQKTMGIIAAVLVIDSGRTAAAASPSGLTINLATVLAAHTAIALGTLSGGWRIVHTLGSKITKLQPMDGFAAESAAAVTLFTTAHYGIPVSTTHTITGAVVGVGTTRRFSAVRWGLTGRVVYAWLLTIPGAAVIAALAYGLLTFIPSEVVAAVGMLAAASFGVLFLLRRRREQVAVFAPP